MADSKRTRGRLHSLAAGGALVLVVAVVAAAAAWTTVIRRSGATGMDLSGLPAMPDDTRHAYEAAPSHHDLFAHLPCYCGCALLKKPHASLEHCFLAPDGSFEAHASGCRICTDIAIEALAMEGEGLDHAAIRAGIDAKYARAGPPTDTPLP